MALIDVHCAPLLVRYRAGIFSRASLFTLACLLLTCICPLLIAYRSHGLWPRTASYVEQPRVTFRHEVLLMLHLQQSDQFLAWSTFQNLNGMLGDSLRIPLVKANEEDRNRDGKFDVLHFSLEMPLASSEVVLSADLLLTFSYQLHRMATVKLQGMMYASHSSPLPGSELHVNGDLMLTQRQPLPHRGLDVRYDVAVINGSSPFTEAYDIPLIIRAYQERNVTTRLDNSVKVWRVGSEASNSFRIAVLLRYPEQTIVYQPGFWEMMKAGWVQYVSILLPFIWLFTRIKDFVFQNQVLSTIPKHPVKQHHA
uniref:Transmembrane protein 231 n=1 Tax=Eptatretus burgeri TaxID=7764 RepID=A0A8C4X199_EPTBU